MTLLSMVGVCPRSALAWVGLAVSASLLLPAPAHADVSFLDVELLMNGGFAVTCNDVAECTEGDECVTGECTEVNANLSVCVEPLQRINLRPFCCDSILDCPVREGLLPDDCRPVVGDVSVCTWPADGPRVYNLCSGNGADPAFATLLACFRTGTLGQPSLAQGDCDGDGLANAMDPEVCRSNVVQPPLDAGITPVEDLGVANDLGMTDAGVTPPVDHGPDVDLGEDQGPTDSPSVGFQGGGGCSAGTVRGVSDFALLCIVAGVLACRRRRSR